MNLLVLSRNPRLYSTRRLVEAAQQRGHDVRVIDYLRCNMQISANRPSIYYAGELLDGVDAVIPRIGASFTFYGTAVVRQFEEADVFSINSSQAISRSRDKLRSLQLLAGAGVDMPLTGFAHASRDVAGTVDLVGGPPLVVKLLEGTQGTGVVLAETRKAAESVIAAFRQLNANILVQKYIAEAGGTDIRALVVGGRVVASMLRRAAPGEFRANVHRGATIEKVRLSPKERAMAVKAAKVMGLELAGVDLLRSDSGPLVLEVNSSPGLEGVETATGVDVAGAIVATLERNAPLRRRRPKG